MDYLDVSRFIPRNPTYTGLAHFFHNFRVMVGSMLTCAFTQFKILNSVIQFIVIDVMNNFFSGQISPYMGLHYKSMLRYVFLFSSKWMIGLENIPITMAHNFTLKTWPALMNSLVLERTTIATKLSMFRVIHTRIYNKYLVTLQTFHIPDSLFTYNMFSNYNALIYV